MIDGARGSLLVELDGVDKIRPGTEDGEGTSCPKSPDTGDGDLLELGTLLIGLSGLGTGAGDGNASASTKARATHP